MRASRHSFHIAALRALLVPLLLLPAAVEAQSGPPSAGDIPAASTARTLELEAESLASRDRAGWKDAASLFVQAAELSGFGTPESIENLRKASYMRYYLGDRRLALELMEEAAGQAVATGQVLLAAHAYIDGALLAIELDRASSAIEFGEKAQLLAASTHLSEGDRGSILGRLFDPELALIGQR